MIECPKCHFRQPKDQYCANCGIDMIAFKPIPESRSKTFFSSGAFQVFIIIFVAALVAYFIVQSDRPQSWVRKFSYAKKINPQDSDRSQKQLVSEELSSTQTQRTIEISAPSKDSVNALVPAQSQMQAPTEGSAQSAASEASTELKFTFAEISRESLQTMILESQRLGLYQSFSDFSAGIILNHKPKSLIKLKDLKSDQKSYSLKKPYAILSGKTIDETSEFLGLQTNIDIKSVENQTAKGHLNITKITRSGKVDLPIEFELQKGSLFFVNWKTAMVGFENDSILFNTPPFQILQSQDFLNQKTEFIILIEPL